MSDASQDDESERAGLGTPIDPISMARRDLKKALPRRFYSDAVAGPAEGGWTVLLDGKPVRTPAKAPLILPTQALAEAVADEWRAQSEIVDPDGMPLTRLANSALDGVAAAREATAAEVAKFAETDLVCYRAGEPPALVEQQAAAWDPVLDFAHGRLGARFFCAEGVMYVAQPEAARAAVRRAVDDAAVASPAGTLRLAALGVMTNLMGSVLLALAVAHDALTPEAAWAAAHVDEDYQIGLWGADEEAAERRERRWRDMAASARLYRLAGQQPERSD